MILSIGEILADMIGTHTGDTLAFARYPGGAPFNVACNLARLGADVSFGGAVGDDLVGDFLADYAATCGFSTLHLRRDPARNTTLAFVELSPDGERSFCFYRKNTADYHIDVAAIAPLIERADIVHLGSLMLSEPEGRAVADAVIELAHRVGKRISFDVNFRDDIYRDTAEAVAIYSRYIAAADIVKYSEDELCLFTGEATTEAAVASLRAAGAGEGSTSLTFVTLGARGSLCVMGGEVYTADTIAVSPVDTTGAGDAFLSGVLSVLDGRPSPTAEEVTRALRLGNICGGLTTTTLGAISPALTAGAVADRLGKTI